MTLPRTPNKATLALQAVWIKAAQAAKPFEFVCETPAAAMQFRIRLYGAVKSARENPHLQPELAAATERCSVRVDPQDKKKIRIGRIEDLDPMMAQVEALLGQGIGELQSAEEQAAEASLRKLMGPDPQALPEAPSLEGIRNKYY